MWHNLCPRLQVHLYHEIWLQSLYPFCFASAWIHWPCEDILLNTSNTPENWFVSSFIRKLFQKSIVRFLEWWKGTYRDSDSEEWFKCIFDVGFVRWWHTCYRRIWSRKIIDESLTLYILAILQCISKFICTLCWEWMSRSFLK